MMRAYQSQNFDQIPAWFDGKQELLLEIGIMFGTSCPRLVVYLVCREFSSLGCSIQRHRIHWQRLQIKRPPRQLQAVHSIPIMMSV